MASSYKKSSGDKFILNLLMIFGGVIAVISAILIVYTVFFTYEYDEFDHLVDLDSVEAQEEDEYLVYIYGENCGACKRIKQKVLRFAHNDDNPKVYLVESSNTSGAMDFVDAEGDIVEGTPSLLIIKDGEVKDVIKGYIEIPQVLDEIKDGDNEYIQ